MGKRQKKTATSWVVFLRAGVLTMGIYLLGILLTALMLVKNVMPETAGFPLVAVFAFLAVLSGGVLAARGSAWGTMPAALLNTAVFMAVLLLVGMACWQEGVGLTGSGSILLLCALAGGMVAGLVGGRRGRRRKRK